MISVDDALETILSQVSPLPPKEVDLLDALGRVLAEDISSDSDIPSLDNSAMDGYAVRVADVEHASPDTPAALSVIADLPAGYLPERDIVPGEAVRIMTGAPIPGGADAVVRVEDTEKADGDVRIFRSAEDGENVRRAGEDVKLGEQVLTRGRVLSAADIGMLASVGKARVNVIRPPVVSILATGDEVIDVSEAAQPGKVRNSNAYTMAAQVTESGGVPRLLGIARDTAEELAAKIRCGLEADVLLTSGGVSMGDYDLVKPILKELGSMVFWKVAMRPGQPLAFGVVEGTPLFGLPGNPTSSMISFEQFVRPTLLTMQGKTKLRRCEVTAVLEGDFKKKPGPRMFLRVLMRREGDVHFARLTGPQGSGILKSMSSAGGLLVLPEESHGFTYGDTGTVLMIHEPEVD